MNKTVFELLNRVSSNQYKAYIVGGYVRDLILGIENKDIDIVTNAPVEFLISEFSSENPKQLKYKTIKFKYGNFNVDIAQIRKETYDGKITRVEYTDDLYDDYLRRDFTFNAIYLSKDNEYYDFDNCIVDCKNLKLRFISNAQEKCIEDPTRLIRAFYFIIKYNLNDYADLSNINTDLLNFDKCNVSSLNTIIYKILKLNRDKDFVMLLKNYNIYDKLFSSNPSFYSDSPIDFLKESNYKYLDSLIKN